MKNLKKVLAVLMVVAMLFALNVTAFAATSDPYLVVGPNTLYSTPITAGIPETLTVTTADYTWTRTGFSSLNDAATGVAAQVTEGVGTISIGPIGSTTEEGFYVATIPVTAVNNTYGPASIHVEKVCDSSAYIDLTVYVEAAATQGPATGITMKMYDAESQSFNKTISNFSVYAAADTSEYEDNIFEGMDACAQSYPTVADALANYAEEKGYYLDATDGYITAFGYDEDTDLVAYWEIDGWDYIGHGWNYAIIRNCCVESDGDIFSATIKEVQNGDVILWVYGTTDDLNDYVYDYLHS